MHPTSETDLREAAVEAVRRLQRAGFQALWAGGCVRDLLMLKRPADYDIATNATPDQAEALFPGSKTVGKSFGVVRAPVAGSWFEIATFRQDHGYTDGRRPDRVSFCDAPTDAARRDFTINAIFYDPLTDRFFDFVDGRRDIQARIVRCVGTPADRFAEDHLRMLRAVRFAAVLDFRIEAETAAAVRAHAGLIARVAPERVRDELIRILVEAQQPGTAIELLDTVGLMDPLLPEVAAMKGQSQPPEFHPEGDVFRHTVLLLNGLPESRPRLSPAHTLQLAFSALLHDVGKPPTAAPPAVEGDRIRFNRHAPEGARLAENILRRFRFPAADIEAISFVVASHMRIMDVRKMRPSTLRRLVGAPTFPVDLELHRLDCLASHGDLENYRFLMDFQSRLAREPALPKPWVTGSDILALGIPQGPQIGLWHKAAYTAQLDGRFASRDELLRWVAAEIGGRRDPPPEPPGR